MLNHKYGSVVDVSAVLELEQVTDGDHLLTLQKLRDLMRPNDMELVFLDEYPARALVLWNKTTGNTLKVDVGYHGEGPYISLSAECKVIRDEISVFETRHAMANLEDTEKVVRLSKKLLQV